MKKIVSGSVLVLGLLIATGTKAQEKSTLDKDILEKDVPAACLKTFTTKNPNQKVDKWEIKAGNYEADYTKDGKFCEFSMKPDGTWIESEVAAEKKDVPQVIWDAIAKGEYKDWTYDHCEKVSTPKYPALYEVTYKKAKKTVGLYYTTDGKTLVRTEKE